MTEHGYIDLDERGGPAGSAGSPPGPVPSRKRAGLYLVATFALGLTLGGIGVANYLDRAQAGTVSVVAMAGSVDGGGVRNGIAQLNAQLMVVNAGPAPITVRFAGAQENGVSIRDTGQSLVLDPDGTGGIDVELRVECDVAEPDPVRMRFSVQTADKQTHEVGYTVAVAGSAWHDRVDVLCGAAPATTG